MGQLTELAEQYQTALSKAPLESLKQAEDYLKDIAAAEAVFAMAKSKVLMKRLDEETPLHKGLIEGIGGQHKAHSQTANVMALLAGAVRKKHAADYERFDNPRNHEKKADYERNKD